MLVVYLPLIRDFGTLYDDGTNMSFYDIIYTGWWYTSPCEKWWSSSVGMIIPNIWKNNKWSKPPISDKISEPAINKNDQELDTGFGLDGIQHSVAI